MRTVCCAILLVTGVLLGGCFSSDPEEVGATNPQSGNGAPTTAPPPAAAFRAQFQPLQGILPYPIDLYFSGSTDGTLNIPANPFQPAVPVLNALDGYSTSSYISARFTAAVDPASLTAATVRVIRLVLDNATKAPLIPPAPGGALPMPLTFGTDYTVSIAQEAGSGGGTVIIRPTRPLEASSGGTNIGYLVVLTNGITSTGGAAATADTDYATVRNQALAELGSGASSPTCTPITNTTLNAICRLTFGHLAVASAVGVNPADVVLTFGFTTQSTRDVLGVVAQTIAASPAPPIVATALPGPGGTLTTADVNPALPGKANIHAGTLRIPYYLTVSNTSCDSAATLANCPPIRSFWTAAGASPVPGIDPASRHLTRFNPVPAKTADVDIPLLVTVPNAASVGGGVRPANGWPVAIFQHGLTRTRADVLLVADAFADAGFVVVAIDLPLHGIGATSLFAAFRQAGNERTFDLDVSNNATLAPGPDGTVDGSGQNFVNLPSLLTTRDNLRQGSVDLFALTRALPTLELTGDATPDINGDRIHFVGHSLGSIVGATYAALSPSTRTASLLMTGGGVAQTIIDSPAFGPPLIAGLQAQGLIPGTTLFNQFIRDAQTAADAGDPLNYMASLLAAKPVHVTQIVGGGTPGWPSDLVVPNSSTQRLITAGGTLIRRLGATGAVAAGNGGFVNFLFGHHGTIIDPGCTGLPAGSDVGRCQAAAVEMQRQTATFAALDGASIVITDTSVIQP